MTNEVNFESWMIMQGVQITGKVLLIAGVCFALGHLFVLPDVYAQLESAVQAFDEGNELYRSGDYSGAVAAYERAMSGGYTSDALFYNTGNAYFRLDELGQAIRYYEKARLLAPENRELLHNLEIARAKAVDQISQLPQPVWMAWWQTMTARSGGRWLFWIGFLFYLAAIAVAVYRIKIATRNDWLRRAIALCLLAGIVFLAAAFSASVQSADAMQAVILAEAVDLHEAPSTESTPALEIHEGLVVDILQRSNGWLQVRLPNGATGWVPAEATGDI